MNSLLSLAVFFLVFHFNYGQNNESELFSLIDDFMNYYKFPNRIIYHVCFRKDSQVIFQKNLQSVGLLQRNMGKYPSHDFHSFNDFNFIFLDMSCPETRQILEKAEKQRLFTISHHWLLFLNSSTEIQSVYYPINSNIYTFTPNYYGYTIKKIYRPSQNSITLIENFIGYWTRGAGYFEVNSIYEDRQNRQLFGETVKMSYVVEDLDTIMHLEDYQYNILTDTLTKFNYALLQHLLYLTNASKTEVFRQHLIGQTSGNVTNMGMIDDLTKDFDIGGTPIKFLSNRVDQFDFLANTVKLEKKFIFRATPHSYIGNVFTLPFDSYVWYSCFGLMATIFIVAYLVVYWEWHDPIFKKYLSPRLSLRPHPVDVFLMEVGSAAQQGFESEPRSNSGRIVFIFTLISLMFLYTSFSASIVALLQSTTESLNSLENLFDSRIPVGFEENISMRYFGELNYEKKSREFYNKIQKPTFLPIKEGVKKVQEEFFAYYADTSKIYKYVKDWFMEGEKCGLREIPFENTHINYWLIMKKNSTYKDIFRAGMNKIHESGLRSREHRRLFTTKPDCDSVGGTFESVGLADSYGAFLVMAAGMVLSLLLFMIENVLKKYDIRSLRQIMGNGDDLDFVGGGDQKYTMEEDNESENVISDESTMIKYEFTI